MKKCKNCKFFEEEKCKRFPPTFSFKHGYTDHYGSGEYIGNFYKPTIEFPNVSNDEWCGEFKDKRPWYKRFLPLEKTK